MRKSGRRAKTATFRFKTLLLMKIDPSGLYLGVQTNSRGSPLPQVNREGLFPVHPPEENLIALFPNGDISFSARIQTLMKARTSVRIQALTFAADESGLYIAEILKYKRAQGLDVRVIVDAFSNLDLQSKQMYFDLQQHGVLVEGYEVFGTEWLSEFSFGTATPIDASIDPNKRFHEKMWVIDGETDHGSAIVGGLNIGNEYFRIDPSHPDRYWRDQDIIVKGSVVKDITAAFDRNYAYFQGIKKRAEVADTDIYWNAAMKFLDELGKWDVAKKHLDPFGKVEMDYETRPHLKKRVAFLAQLPFHVKFREAKCRFFQNRPRFEESYITQAYLKLIRDAKSEILIANAYFVPSKTLISALKDAATRGVRIAILTNGLETNDLPDITIVGRSYYKELLSVNQNLMAPKGPPENGGIQIWEWQGRKAQEKTRKQGTFHAKFAVFDREISLVGSHNLDPRSENLNSETAIVFESKPLSEQLANLFDSDLKFSKKISFDAAKNFEVPSTAAQWLRKAFGSVFEAYF